MTSASEKNDFQIELIDDMAEVSVLEDALAELDERHPPETVYQSKDFLLPWLSYSSRKATLQARVLRTNGAAAVLPLMADVVRRGPFRVRRLGFPTHGGHPPSLDLRCGEKEALAAAEELLSAYTARGAGWHLLSLRHLSGSSALLRILPGLCRERGLVYSCLPARREGYLVLEGDWDSYVARLTMNHRREVRRCFKRVSGADGWELYDMWPTEGEVQGVLDRYLAVLGSSWKSAEEDGHFVEFLDGLMRSFAARGDLLLSWLKGPEGDGAALLQLRRGGMIAAFHQAYDERCPIRSPGTALLGYAISRAFELGTVIYDFSTSAEHIHRWGPLYRNTCHVYVTKRSPLGWIIQRQMAKRH